MAVMIVVLDASVALKWSFTDEEATNEALALLNDFVEGRVDLIAPDSVHLRSRQRNPRGY